MNYQSSLGYYLHMNEKDRMELIRQYLAEIGRKGGLSRSEKKAAAVRENGKKGGRPPKSKKAKKGGNT